jgi:branched-chain amino acid transport system permease protein
MRVADLSLPLSLAALVAVPFMFGDFTAYQIGLFLLYGIVAQGIALCWGRVGILPLGQALFFGLGAYLGGGALIRFEHSPIMLYPTLLGAVLAPAVVAGAIGLLVFRRNVGSGPYFSLITLALSMLAYQVALGADWLTGGYMGLNGIPPLPGTDPWSTLYWVILGALVLSTGVLLWITRSPLGQLLHAVSQNEDRLSFLGFDIARLKALAFAVSAALAGMAGALYAAQQGIVTPQVLAYVLSGELLIWTAVGGRASLIGPVAGAVLIGMLTSNLRDTFQYWEILLAILFLAIVLFAPTGLAGLIVPLLKRLPKRAHAVRDVERPLPDRGDMPTLSFEEVRVTIGSVRILQGLTLELKKRGLHCLIGPNGAGKTSAFNALTGRLTVSGGRITWGGRDITGLPAHKVARLGIARKLQVPAIFHDMTVGVHLDIALWSGGISGWELLGQRSFRYRNEILGVLKEMFPFLNDEDKRAGDLSLGHRQVLEFALSVVARPEVVLLDEPCAGLSTQETADLTAAMRKIAGRFDISALIIEHDFSVVEELSDHIFVLHQGQTLSEGTLEAIRADHKVQAVYTGGTK